jgi:hypothetical protein
MKFEIAFNYEDKNDTKEFYDFIGAILNRENEESYYEIELNTFEELEQLMNKINMKYFNNTFRYSTVIAFNRPVIFLDDKI